MRIHSVALYVCALLLFASAGCTPSKEGPKLVPVQGTVTMDGKPLAGASVMFGGGVAFGETNASGHYELSQGEKKGIPAGEYKVVIEKWTNPDGSVYKSAGISPMEAGAKQEIPARYSHPEQSELKKTVPEAGGTIDFELTSK